MTLSIGGVTIPVGEHPYDCTIGYAGAVSMSEATPLGYVGTIVRKQFTKAAEHELKMYLTNATRAAVQALVDADQDMELVFIWNDGGLNINQTCTLVFSARQKPLDVATNLFDCTARLIVLAAT